MKDIFIVWTVIMLSLALLVRFLRWRKLKRYDRLLDDAARRINKRETDAGRPPIWDDV